MFAAAQARGLNTSSTARQARHSTVVAGSSGHQCASPSPYTPIGTLPTLAQLQQQWQQLTHYCAQYSTHQPQPLPCASVPLPAAPHAAAASNTQQQHAPLPCHRLFHSSAAPHKRMNIRDQQDEDLMEEDELEVLLDEDEEVFDFDQVEIEEGEALDDPEWVGDGELATSRHMSGRAGSYGYRGEDDDVGEYDVEFDEAWEDEEEVDDLREQEDSESASEQQQQSSLRSALAESLRLR